MKDLEAWTWVQTAFLVVVVWTWVPYCPWYCSVSLTVSALYVTRLLTIANRQERRWAVRGAVQRTVRQVVRQAARG